MLTPAGHDSPCRALAGTPGPALARRHLRFAGGAELLASTAAVRNQAFAFGPQVLGLQFHVEADASRIESWLIGHAYELTQAGIDPNVLRAGAAKHGWCANAGTTG